MSLEDNNTENREANDRTILGRDSGLQRPGRENTGQDREVEGDRHRRKHKCRHN